MAVHQFRVRRSTTEGPQVVGFFKTFGKAYTFAAKRMSETGAAFRIERHVPLSTGWETATELRPTVGTAVEEAIARGHMPKVQDANGRKGQVLSYIRPTRQVRVAWLDEEKPGRGEVQSVDALSLR